MTPRVGIPHSLLRHAKGAIRGAMFRDSIKDGPLQSFITRERLERVWQEQKNGRCLLDEFEPHVPGLSREEIETCFLHIISILILMHWENWPSFTDYFGLPEHKRKDVDLPFSPDLCEEIFRSSPGDAREFHQHQYAFIPVIIEPTPIPHFLEPQWRLPLTFEGEKNEDGSFGTVYKVKIARGYFREKNGKTNDKEITVARKVFNFQPNYTKELENLSVLRSGEFHHNSVMEHLGSVVIGGVFSIFYPWAECNLEEFFDDSKRPSAIRNTDITPKRLLQESLWLADALEFLHTRLRDKDGNEIQCCHMDLKPDNILVMLGIPDHPLGQWKIADFGISNIEPRSMSPSIRDFYSRTTTTRPGTKPTGLRFPRYEGPFQPPEAEDPRNKTRQATKDLNDLKGDVWSFGCILLVILVFAVGGNRYVDELVERRQVGLDRDNVNRSGRFYRNLMGFQVMPPVSFWLSSLSNDQGGWLQKAWQFIQRHMLVIDPTKRVETNVITSQIGEWERTAEPENTWAEAPDPLLVTQWQGVRLASNRIKAETKDDSSIQAAENKGLEYPLVPSENSNIGQQLRNATNTPTILELTESPESILQTSTETTGAENENILNNAAAPTSTFEHGRKPSEVLSQTSDISNSSEMQTVVNDLAEHLNKETDVVVASDGRKILFINQQRAKVFRRGLEEEDIVATENSTELESGHKSSWEQGQLAGNFLVLRDKGTMSISSCDLSNGDGEQIWDSRVQPAEVLGFDVSSRGSIAFRSGHKVQVFMSLKSAEPTIDWERGEEHVKAVAFSRSGDRLIVVCDMRWITWDLEGDSKFTPGSTDYHQFSRPEHGTFEPFIVPFNSAPYFLIWDKRYRDRIAMIQQGSSTIWSIPADTTNVAISHDDQYLILLTTKKSLRGLGKCRYTLRWTKFVLDRARKLAIEREYQSHTISIKGSSGALQASLVALKDSGVNYALIAFANGSIQQVRLAEDACS